MAQPKSAPLSLQIVAIFSRHTEALNWARDQISTQWGQIALVSPTFDQSETTYYEAEMGSGLVKQFLLMKELYDPELLAKSKLISNVWEEELAQQHAYEETRPLNIDPGYITLTKLVLASAKDRAHRMYMADGIYAEECLYYLDHRWQPRPWTYPDYRRPDFHEFFIEARAMLKRQIQTNATRN